MIRPHKTIIQNAIAALEADTYTGYCLVCGHEHENIEPDAAKYQCENCGNNQVYGAFNIVLMFA